MKPCSLSPDDPMLVPIAALLSRIERELRDLASASDELQTVISPALSVDQLLKTGLFPAVQSLDHMSQTLCAIADFVKAVASTVPNKWQIDPRSAAVVLSLADLAARLTQSKNDSETAKLSRGDCEHF